MGEQQPRPDEQVYPQDTLFQQYLLALAVQDPTFLAANRACLKPEHFGEKGLRFLAQGILDFFDQYGQVPSYASMSEWVASILRSGKHRDISQRVVDITNFLYQGQVPNPEYLKSKAVHFARWQALKRTVMHAIQVLRKDGDPEEAQKMFQEALSLGVVQDGDQDLYDVAVRMPDIWQEMLNSHGVIPTLFMPSLDRALHAGGPRRGEFYVFSAPKKVGKSMLLCECGASALVQGHKVLHITIGDLKEFDVEHRYLARLTNTPMKTILRGGSQYYSRLGASALRRNQLRIKYYSPNQLTTAQLRSYVSWLATTQNFKPDMLIIDYPDKMYFDRRNTYGEMSRIYMELQGIMRDFSCVGWAVSQSNRGSAKETLNTSANVSESWDKPAIVDGFIPITRLDKQGKDVKESTLEELDFDSGDHSGQLIAYMEDIRFGHDGFQIKMYYDYTRCYIQEDSPYTQDECHTKASMDQAQAGLQQAQMNVAQQSRLDPNGWMTA